MLKRALLVVPALAGLAFLTTRLTPGPLKDGTTLLPSGWRIHPAGRQIAVGTLPLNLATLSDRSLVVTNNGYGENGLMRVDPVAGRVVWRHPLRAAWLGLARSGREWRDTVWASGGGTNRVYRLIWLGGAGWTSDSATLADTSARLFAAGLALVPDRKSTRLNSSHLVISYAVFCLKKKKTKSVSSAQRLKQQAKLRNQDELEYTQCMSLEYRCQTTSVCPEYDMETMVRGVAGTRHS